MKKTPPKSRAPRPPRLADALLELFYNAYEVEEIQGDLHELFERRVTRYEDRHRVKAGITGWAQVHGLRGKTSLSDRIEWDNYYIENWSLSLDFKILLMTAAAIFQRVE